VLGSYHYLKSVDMRHWLGSVPGGADFLADSGGFSAMTVGAQISVGEYAEWLRHYADVITCAATLDVIGDWRATARNTDRLIDLVGGAVPIVPAFHVRSPWAELRRLCRDHPYVALGGLVRLSGKGYQDAMIRWAANAHLIARDHDTRLHGFGLTRMPYPAALPWYSVDSAYWSSAARTGSLSLWNDRTRRFDAFRVGTETARPHARLIGEYGGDAHHACAYGYGVVGRVGDRGRADRGWLQEASLASWLRYERFLHRTKDRVPPPRGAGIPGDGIKIYIAVGSTDQLRTYLTVAAREGLIPAGSPA
jgi:hypothetical protein